MEAHDSLPATGAQDEWSETGRSPRVTSSCAECRRRRIKCEGLTTPCRQCIYYQVPHLCHYPARKARRNVSWRSHSELSDAHAKSLKVLDTLFASSSLDELSAMTREQLVAKAQSQLQFATSSTSDERPHDDLRVLEPSPERNFTWDEVSDDDDSQTSRVADDVNGLALSLESLNASANASYLGLSSVPTILRLISQLSPQIRQVFPTAPLSWKSPTPLGGSPDSTASSQYDEMALINTYFCHVHLSTPMINEADFRQRYAEGGVSGTEASSWSALLNMVLAMGCLASDTSKFGGHNVFYKRALPHLSILSFGSGHLYTVQALALYGGYILHYLNKPNTASAVIGATIRMAVAMGLHRVQMPRNPPAGLQAAAESSIITRIRTWWSIFCLDTWAAATLGRPGLGYWNPATVLTSPTSSLSSFDYGTISLAASEQFCKIATRSQERLVRLPLITPDEVHEFDQEFLTWQGTLHMFLASRAQCPPHLRVARAFLWCRLMTTRLTLYRPYLLSAALRQGPWSEIREPERVLVHECVEVAKASIDVIALDWFPNQMLAWNDAWHLFQISLVLILAILSDSHAAKERRCGEYIDKAIDLFILMEPLNAGATRSREVIQLLRDNTGNMVRSESMKGYEPLGSSALDLLDIDLVGDNTDWVAFLCAGN